MSSWRPALRIARRTVLRSRGRSLLIAILVGVPVAGATFADVLARTFDSPERTAQQMIGAADAAVTVTRGKRLPGYDPRWLMHGSSYSEQRDPGKVEVAPLLLDGTRIVPMPLFDSVALQRGTGVIRTRVLIGDVREPLHRHALRLDAGRAPGAAEVLVSRSLAERLKLLDDGRLRAGSVVKILDGPSARVSGVVRDPGCLSCPQLAALPGSRLDAATARDRQPRYSSHGTSDPTFSSTSPRRRTSTPSGARSPRAASRSRRARRSRTPIPPSHPARTPRHSTPCASSRSSR